MYGYIYKTTFLETGLYYVGQHKASHFEPENYLGSGTIFLRILRKQQKKAALASENWKECWHKYFSCEMLQACGSLEELSVAEAYWVEEFRATDRAFGYNITPGGWGGSLCQTSATRAKISDWNKNKITITNGIERFKIDRNELTLYQERGFKLWVPQEELSVEHKKAISETLTGYRCIHKGTVKTRVPASELGTYLADGYVLGWSKKEKLSKLHEPKKGMVSPAGRYKYIAESMQPQYINKGWVFGAPKREKTKIHYGIKPTEETRKKLSEAHKGKKPSKEAIEKQAAKLRNRITINKDGNKKLIMQDDLAGYLAEGWIRGGLCNINSRSKPVICFETSEHFCSVTAAMKKYLGKTGLKECLKRAPESTWCGLHWYYEHDTERQSFIEALKIVTKSIDLEF